MKITTYAYTNQGGRHHNEDSIRAEQDERRTVLVLADGLGGHGGGERASALAAEAVCSQCFSCQA